MIEQCPICYAQKMRHRFELATPYLDRKEKYQLYQCQQCGHAIAEGCVDDQLLGRIYAGHFHDSSQQSRANEHGLNPIEYNAKQRATWLKTQGLSGRLLDIGAGKGYFVKAAAQFFSASGLEYSASAAMAAQDMGLNVVAGDIYQQHSFCDQTFDVITLWDVLSGLAKPQAVMRHISDLLKKNGTLILTLPDPTSRFARICGRFWPMWIPPVNIHYYSLNSISTLLNEFGMSLTRHEYPSKQVAIRFVYRKLCRSLRIPYAEKMATIIPRNWSKQINLNDILMVVAVKQ